MYTQFCTHSWSDLQLLAEKFTHRYQNPTYPCPVPILWFISFLTLDFGVRSWMSVQVTNSNTFLVCFSSMTENFFMLFFVKYIRQLPDQKVNLQGFPSAAIWPLMEYVADLWFQEGFNGFFLHFFQKKLNLCVCDLWFWPFSL